jgi:hypothetical protein
MMAYLGALDIDYEASFSCPICQKLPHSAQVVIVDGKAMGLPRVFAQAYTPPVDKDVSIGRLWWVPICVSTPISIYVLHPIMYVVAQIAATPA